MIVDLIEKNNYNCTGKLSLARQRPLTELHLPCIIALLSVIYSVIFIQMQLLVFNRLKNLCFGRIMKDFVMLH